VTGPGIDPTSRVLWIAAGGGLYGVQNLKATEKAVNVSTSATLYRITAVGIVGNNVRSVVESIYAKW
jgi:type IV pilus assembly protein PilX